MLEFMYKVYVAVIMINTKWLSIVNNSNYYILIMIVLLECLTVILESIDLISSVQSIP